MPLLKDYLVKIHEAHASCKFLFLIGVKHSSVGQAGQPGPDKQVGTEQSVSISHCVC